MSIFFMLVVLLAIDVHAGMTPKVIKTYDDQEEKTYYSTMHMKEELTPLVKSTRAAWPLLPVVLHRIIESYYEKAWVPVAHMVDDRRFDFLRATYFCLTYMNGKFAAGNNSGNLEIYDLSTSKLVKQIKEAHDICVTAVTYAPDTQTLYSSGHDNRIKIWGPRYACQASLAVPRIYATELLLFDQNMLISGNYFGDVHQWDIETQKEKILRTQHVKGITSLAKLNDTCLVSSSFFGMVDVLDISTNTRILGLDNSKTFYNKVAVVNDHQFIVACKNRILFYDTRTRKSCESIPYKQEIRAITMLGKSIITGEEDGTLRLHDIVLDKLLPGPQFPCSGKKDILALAAAPDGSNFISVAEKPVGTLTHWRYTH